MRLIPIVTASALIALSLGFANSANAAVTNYSVNCASSNSANFEINEGDQIIFDMNNVACSTILTNATVTNDVSFQALVNSIADLSGTGGTAVATFASKTVTYTAGSLQGTDSLNVTTLTRWMSPRPFFIPKGTASYRMTTARSSEPPAWLQMYARPAGAECAATWNPSWAEWPNGGRGGFVCVREYYYAASEDGWFYRSS